MITTLLTAAVIACSTPTAPVIVEQIALTHGWKGDQVACMKEIIRLESRWNPHAKNRHSSAYGLFQMLNEKHGSSAFIQIINGSAYIAHRYKTPCKALIFHSSKGYY